MGVSLNAVLPHALLLLALVLLAPITTAQLRHVKSQQLDAVHAQWNERWRPSWQTYYHRLNNVMVSNQRLSALLGSLLGHWEYTVPEVQLRRGLVYTGSNHRLRAVVQKAMSGQPVKIGVIGGSISYGTGTSQKGVTDWSSLLGAWAAKAFPNVTVRNGCVPGTPSSYMVMCLDMSVDPDVDIVFSEYILNDGRADMIQNNPLVKNYERLVRRVLSLPKKPPMIMMQTFSHGTSFPHGHASWTPFHDGIEDVYGALAHYYDVQWLSLRDTTYRLASFVKEPGFDWGDITNGKTPFEDYIHMNDKGHKIMADLAVWLFQQTAIDLLLHPLNEEDQELLAEDLPPPMVPGNWVPTSPMCMHFEAMQPLVADAQGFSFVEEGPKKKKGYVGTTPGSSITFKLNTSRTSDTAATVIVQLAHLRSYEHMGIGVATCVAGCSCPEKRIDGHHNKSESQTYLATLQVTQSPDCRVKVTIAPETSNGEHKVKISGIMISDQAGSAQSGQDYLREVEWKALDNAAEQGGYVQTRGNAVPSRRLMGLDW